MSVPQWTTPTFTLTFKEPTLDLTGATNVYVTFHMGFYTLTKSGDNLVIGAKQIDVHLKQEETGHFGVGEVEIQANWTDSIGNRCASEITRVEISPQLLKKVVE